MAGSIRVLEKQEIIWMVERSDLGANRTCWHLGILNHLQTV